MGSKVAVLLAAYNGGKWIDEQVQSILSQKNVQVDIFFSVDTSTDDTFDKCSAYAQQPHMHILPYGERFGGAAKNFYRLIRDVNFESFDYVAFADQDDIWLENKLSNAISILSEEKYDCYSSNVLAFWSDGRKKIINKAQPQVSHDYFFESAGPGCTYVFSKDVAKAFQMFLIDKQDAANAVELHDWLLYAFARHNGYKWHIDDWQSMLYRQHDSNQFGANGGIAAAKKRIQMIRSRWYINEILKIINVLNADQDKFLSKSLSKGYPGHVYMALNINKIRRKISDRISLSVILLSGLFR